MELLKALEPDFETKEDSIARHDYRQAQAVAIEKLSEMEIMRRLESREG